MQRGRFCAKALWCGNNCFARQTTVSHMVHVTNIQTSKLKSYVCNINFKICNPECFWHMWTLDFFFFFFLHSVSMTEMHPSPGLRDDATFPCKLNLCVCVRGHFWLHLIYFESSSDTYVDKALFCSHTPHRFLVTCTNAPSHNQQSSKRTCWAPGIILVFTQE